MKSPCGRRSQLREAGADEAAELGLEVGHVAGREAPVDEPAVAGVVGRVHHDDRRREPELLQLVGERQPRSRRERRGVAGRGEHRLEPAEHPVAAGGSVHRVLVAEAPVQRERIPPGVAPNGT